MIQDSLFAARGNRAFRPDGVTVSRMLPRLLAALDERGWVSAAVLADELGTDTRTIREAAHESGGLVISGQQGYALTMQASIEDVDTFTGRMYSQAREMRERAMQVERVRHGRGPA